VRGVVETSDTGFVKATNHSYDETMALLKSRQLPNNALNTSLLVGAMDTATLSPAQRLDLIRTVAADDHSFQVTDQRRQKALVSLLDVLPGARLKLATALYQGEPGARLADRISRAVTDDDLDLKLNRALGKEMRIARDNWAASYTSPDPKLRGVMGTVAASRKVMQSTFPFNDGPYSGISATIQDNQISLTLNGKPPVALGAPFEVPKTTELVQAEVAKRFNQHYYGIDTAPPAFLNALIIDREMTAKNPGAALAGSIKRVNGNDLLTVDAATWGRFTNGKAATPEAVKKLLIEEYSPLFSRNQASKLPAEIQVQGGMLVMPLLNAKKIVEAKQLNGKALEFFAHDTPPSDFVKLVNNKLKFVLPYELATAFQPLAETKVTDVGASLEQLAVTMTELQLGAPVLSDDRKSLLIDIDDAKRLMAASMFSYGGDAPNDIRNVYGGAQLSAASYLPMDTVAKGGAGVTTENRDRELAKREAADVPIGAQATKLRRLGFEIEKEVATPLGQALVLRNDKLGLVRVVFRGSDRVKDFVTDARAAQVPFEVDGKYYLGPAGFVKSVQSLYPELAKAAGEASAKLRAAGKEPKLGSDGHSKGGAESALFAFMAHPDIDKGLLPKMQQVNLIEPARSISRWHAVKTGGWEWVSALSNIAAGYFFDITGKKTSNQTALDVYNEKGLKEATTVWAMSRDVVPHVGLYKGYTPLAAWAAGRTKPGKVMHFDEANGLTHIGFENKPSRWYASDPFVDKQTEAFFDQGAKLSSHMMGTVIPSIFNQIGSGVVSD